MIETLQQLIDELNALRDTHGSNIRIEAWDRWTKEWGSPYVEVKNGVVRIG